ncbi:MAG TPA: hypothetical protein VD993_17670 [Chitinophagaceae bacterium]|nr:hypothetical protein [Chitinophagaceae bacterium]
MRRSAFKTLVIAIKTLVVVSLIGFVCLFLLAMKARQLTDDIWKQLGLTQADANKNIVFSFRNGQFLYYGAKQAKNIVGGNRVAVVNELAAYAKKYSTSEEFRKEYLAFRAMRKPKEPMKLEDTPETIRAEEKERIENAIKMTEANANSPNEKIRNAVPHRLEALKKELAALDDPNNNTIKRRMDFVTRTNEQLKKQHEQAMQKYETEFPENPQLLIKRRLQQMLDITADVDYNAELKEAWGKKVFVNPAYEKKPAEWKLAYRSGKPATDAMRAFATKWLQELSK